VPSFIQSRPRLRLSHEKVLTDGRPENTMPFVAVVAYCWRRRHGRRSRGGWTEGKVPQNLEWGTLMQIVPQILSYWYKNKRSVAFKITKSVSGRRTPLGELTTPPSPLVGWEGTPVPIPYPHSAPTHLRRSPCVPRIPARSTPISGGTKTHYRNNVGVM